MNRKISASKYLASMSNCVTLADDALEQQKEISPEITVEDVVEFVLEEAVWAAVVFSDKDRIGDFSIGGEFRQDLEQVPMYSKDFEGSKLNGSEICMGGNPQMKLESGESIDRSISLMTARENLELIFDSLVKREEKIKILADCKVVSERMLAHNELRIENGQIHLDRSSEDGKDLSQLSEEKGIEEKKEETKTESPVIDNFDTISMPSSEFFSPLMAVSELKNEDELEGTGNLENCPSPYVPSPAQDLRQVCSVACSDPNRPRVYALAEEDVKKMVKEIEQIPFRQVNGNPHESALESKPSRNEDRDRRTSGSYSTVVAPLSRSFDATIPLAHQIEEKTFSGCNYPQENDGELTVNEMTNMPALHQRSSEPETTIRDTDLAGVADESNDSSHNSSCGERSPSEAAVQGIQRIGGSWTMCPKESSTEPRDSLKDIPDGKQNYIISATSMHSNEKQPETTDQQQLAIEETTESHSKHSISENCVSGILDSQRESTLPSSGHHNAASDFSLNGLKGNEDNSEVSGEGGCAAAKREPETASSDSRLNPEKRNWNLKGSYSAHIASESGPEYLRTCLSGPQPGAPIDQQLQKGSATIMLEKEGEVPLAPSREIDFFTQNIRGAADVEQSQVDAESTPTSSYGSGKQSAMTIEKVVLESYEDTLNERSFLTSEICKGDLTELNAGDVIQGQEVPKEDVSSLKEENEDLLLEENNTCVKHARLPVPSGSMPSGSMPSGSMPSGSVPSESSTSRSKIECLRMGSWKNFEEKDSSDDNIIGKVENVIQIIDPADNSNDEDAVSFCLPDELEMDGSEIEGDGSQEKEATFISESGRRMRSGMTTIGPMKNINQDPKDLTCDVDFGKITHITSYRKDTEDLGAESSATERREFVQIDSHVNHDIASLTKVQKIREVMSYHPKHEDDYDDDNNLNRLDLKDVESMTDDRYKPQDVSIPLLSFDVRDGDSHGSKDLVQNLNLVLSGNCFANGNFYLTNETAEEATGETEDKRASGGTTTAGSEQLLPRDSRKTPLKPDAEDLLVIEANEDASNSDVFLQTSDSDSFNQKKHNTLGSVFRKASTKLIHKDGDFHQRNTKSLPRDASKLMATESIKSLLEDCQSSAANVLKKSRSFLKNTQALFRTISQTRFPPATSDLNRQKLAPSELEIPSSDTNIHSFFSKEDFTKAKIIIKNKLEKAFKPSDNSSRQNLQHPLDKSNSLRTTQIPAKHPNLSLCPKETNHADQQRRGSPQLKDTHPKTLQPYKIPFTGSKDTLQNPPMQDTDSLCPDILPKSHSIAHQHLQKVPLSKERNHSVYNNKSKKIDPGETLLPESKGNEESTVPDYIIMETIEGLPTPDMEDSCYLVEVEISESPDAVSIENAPLGTLMKNEETVKNEESLINGLPLDQGISLQSRDAAKYEENECIDTDKKSRNKGKKLTARLRNFWSSAFAKVKASPTKKESSEQTYK